MIKNILSVLFVCLAILSWRPGPSVAATDQAVSVHPETIQIGAGYNGEQVLVTGRVPSAAQVLIRIKGKVEDYKLKEKGRALGILWMNRGSVEISNVPNLFLVFPPPASGDAAQNDDPAWQALGLGLEGIRKTARIDAQDKESAGLFGEFVKLKETAGLYGIIDGAIDYGPVEGQMKSFKASLALPAALPQGDFDIEVLALGSGAVETVAVRRIEAKEVGLPAWIANLAFHHGALYGVLAVTTAILAGLLTGIMFKGEKGAH